ncbi:hydroxyproline-rich glycoprotein family protein [Euphorbia peplus]|nr:hydroxyproline-rich glycoprotein family protein [Euphorbia peplus]
MEDSEKRRERLKAMRTEAAQADASSYVDASAASGFLANPLLESPATAQELPLPTPRFDFYTDPMAAFSASRRTGAGNQAAQEYCTPPSNISSPAPQFSSRPSGLWNPRMATSPAHQMQSYHSVNPSMAPPTNQMQNYQSSNQRMDGAQGPYYNVASHGSPRFSPSPMHQGTHDPRGMSGRFAYSSASHRGSYPPAYQGNPGFQPRGSPTFNDGHTWVTKSASIGSGHRGRGNSSERNQGQWHGGGRQSSGGGRGRGFRSQEELRPESFYDKSMFEDPWQQLEPVVWRGANNPHSSSSSGSWLPASISKKAKVSGPSIKLSSEQSLAEYLAQSFNEAASNTPSA